MWRGVVMRKLAILITTMIIGTSCSLVKTTAINSTAGIMQDGSGVLNQQGDWEQFRSSASASLTMLEGFWFADQSNTKLLSLLIKGYGGLGFGVNETLALDDQLADREDSSAKLSAIRNYTKSYDFGIRFMQEKGISEKQLHDKNGANLIPKLLKENLNEDDKIAAFYFAQSWGGLINLQRANVSLLSKLPNVKAIMDWVCKDDMDFEFGSCKLFYAFYEAGRPVMLGGNPQKGRELFEKYIDSSPLNLLARVSFIQFYIIPMMDETLYAKQAEFLKKEFLLWEESLNLGTRKKQNQKYVENKDFNLFNSIAKKRFEIIEKHKKDIF
jgi:hypothetical protein